MTLFIDNRFSTILRLEAVTKLYTKLFSLASATGFIDKLAILRPARIIYIRDIAPAMYHKSLAAPVEIRETVRMVPRQVHFVLSV